MKIIMHVYHLEVVVRVDPPWPKMYGVRKVITDVEARSGWREMRDVVEAMAWAEMEASLSKVDAKIERIPRAGWRTETLGEDAEDRTIEAETAMLAERDRLRAGIGTNDELADYEAARRMIQDGE